MKINKKLLSFVSLFLVLGAFSISSANATSRYGRRQLHLRDTSKDGMICANQAENCSKYYNIDKEDFFPLMNAETDEALKCQTNMLKCKPSMYPDKKSCTAMLDACEKQFCAGGGCTDVKSNIDLAVSCMTNENYFFVYGCVKDIKGKAAAWAAKGSAMAQQQTMALQKQQSDAQIQLQQQAQQAQIAQAQAQAQAEAANAQAQVQAAQIAADAALKQKQMDLSYQEQKDAAQAKAAILKNKDPNADFLNKVFAMSKSLKSLNSLLTDAKTSIGYMEISTPDKKQMWYLPSADPQVNSLDASSVKKPDSQVQLDI